MQLRTKYKDTVITKIDGLIDTEYAISRCFEHLASLIHNGRAKKKFIAYADTAKKNKEIFLSVFKGMGASDCLTQEKCSLCKVDPASFSLSGALNLGMEMSDVAIRYYQDLVSLCASDVDKKEFKRMLKEKTSQKEVLKKERAFERSAENSSGTTEAFQMPDIVSRLYK